MKRRLSRRKKNEDEQSKRKRYPHQKAPKNLSTDQFFEKLKDDAESAKKKAERPRKERSARERRRAKAEEAAAPEAQAASDETRQPLDGEAFESAAPKNASDMQADVHPAAAADAAQNAVEP